MQAQKQVKEDNRQWNEEASPHTMDMLSEPSCRAVVLAQQKGASTWLGTLPIEEHEFTLHKGAFRDALYSTEVWMAP